MIADMAFSIFIEVVYILYNDCLWYDCWFGFFQFLLRWFIFCTMIAYGMIAGMAVFNFYWGGSYFVQWLPMVWLLVWLFSIFIEVVHILYNDCLWCVIDCWYGVFNLYWGGLYFVQWLPMVWLLVWLFSIFIEVVYILYNDWLVCFFSFFIEGVHILYNDCLWYDCWFGFFQLLLRGFIFRTMIAYSMIAGLAFFNCYWGGSYFVQWLPMVWLLVWLFSIVIEVVHILYNDCLWYSCWFGFFQLFLRWFIFCTMIAYGMIAGYAFFNCYWGGSYFVQWLPMVWLLVWLFSIVIEVVHILYNDCLWYSCWFGFFQLLLRWFIFCTMIAYGMTAGLAFFQLLLRWFIFCTMIAYGMIAGLAFFNCYWGGSYFVQWLPMV